MLKKFKPTRRKAASYLELVLMVGIIIATIALMASYVVSGGVGPYHAGISPAVESLSWRLASVGVVLIAIGVTLGCYLHASKRKTPTPPDNSSH